MGNTFHNNFGAYHKYPTSLVNEETKWVRLQKGCQNYHESENSVRNNGKKWNNAK